MAAQNLQLALGQGRECRNYQKPVAAMFGPQK
jgi:hypothetical protein